MTASLPAAPSFPTTSLPLAVRMLANGNTVRVATAEDGELVGRFRRFDGETLVLGMAGDVEADIPVAEIRAISRPRHRALEAAAVAAPVGAAPFVWMGLHVGRDSGSHIDEGLIAWAFILAMVAGALMAVLGAVVGAAIRRREPLFAAPNAAS
jgi:hypothetical protein